MHPTSPGPSARTEDRGTAATLGEFLRQETTGGRLLLLATAVALIWANVAPGAYEQVWGAKVGAGPDWLHLHLTLAHWASDALLAIFFFVAGVEVKRELTIGELAGWRRAALPLFAAGGGMIAPAAVALAVSRGAAAEGGAWAIPVATDIAFALGILALAGAGLPAGVRVLLLSMAVIDDLGAIALIALLFTSGLNLVYLVLAVLLCALYWWLHRRRITAPWIMVPLAVAVWICVHGTGVHATVAGIALGLLTPVAPIGGEKESAGSRLEHRLHPLSAGLIVPLFALAAAGIPVGAFGDALTDPLAHGVFFGLLAGKFLGVLGGSWLAVRLGIGTLPSGVGWGDVVPVAMLGGIGYTVSLLVSQLATADAATAEIASTAVLAASLLASVIAIVLLRRRGRVHQAPPTRTAAA
ncbi:Na+/H+ antiporter NhaA [Actinomadura sp. BRA 177]|uniref:Na+/H+ antiporter NhaA n=1 Tax=Actinomadura sp. BRA 177 TaxID=2745202 RepID=UPI0015962F54|nr:Na+/H+ antiporter NhaA [Actinomadura sp. BRA 177]NVI90917.1 Na+/H+ antiporter NhaA [Actinomadura sp. BRA 177]